MENSNTAVVLTLEITSHVPASFQPISLPSLAWLRGKVSESCQVLPYFNSKEVCSLGVCSSHCCGRGAVARSSWLKTRRFYT